MNKERLSQILGILLLPYLEKNFNIEGKDVIENVRYAFARLRKRSEEFKRKNGCEVKAGREKLRKEYERCEGETKEFLRNLRDFPPRSLDDLILLMNLYFPEEKIADLYDDDMDNVHSIEKYYFCNIFRIARSLLTFRDGEAAIRTWMNEKEDGDDDIFGYSDVFDKVEVWNLISRKMVPDIFIVAFYIEADLYDPYFLYGQTGRILLADKTLERLLEKGIAETHFHMNAGIEYELLWEKVTNFEFWEDKIVTRENYENIAGKQEETVGLHIVIFRLVLAHYLESSAHNSWNEMICAPAMDPFVKKMVYCLYQGQLPEYEEEWVENYEKLRDRWEQNYGKSEGEDYLLSTIYQKYKRYETYSEMILLRECIGYLRRNPHEAQLLHLFFQYIRIKNYFYSSVVQSGCIRGLENFQLIYGNMTHKVKAYIPNLHDRMEAIFKSMFHNIHLKKMEIRIKPPDPFCYNFAAEHSSRKDLKKDILDYVGIVLREYARYIQKAQEHKLSIPTVGIIFHFIKRDSADNRIADMCWILKELPADSNHILQWRKQMVKCAQAIEELRSEIPLLSEYIVGIDAASVENKAEPWVFAPVYAAIRNRKITKPLLKDKDENIIKINNIGFTYHVGEEFRHVLSGLRHVDEVIKFFYYKAGDRIGHAIVLGINIDRWIEENEVVIIPLIEYLEDLLWIWGLIVHEGAVFSVSMDVIEGKILELAKQAYGEIIGVTPNMLYDAYLGKFQLNNQDVFDGMQKLLCQKESKTKHEHFCRYYNPDTLYGVIWIKEKILCSNFCPIYYQKLQKPIVVHIGKKISSLLKEAQEWVVRRVEQKGIYVEVNPTSNLVIGETSSMTESHIFKLNSQTFGCHETAEHEVMVTVNSDDPIIFNTSSENELAYIYHAMNYKGYGKETVLKWVDKVRQFGMDSCFIKQEKEPKILLQEINLLLESIEAYQRAP